MHPTDLLILGPKKQTPDGFKKLELASCLHISILSSSKTVWNLLVPDKRKLNLLQSFDKKQQKFGQPCH